MEVDTPLNYVCHELDIIMACLHVMLEVDGVGATVVHMVVEELKRSLETLQSSA